MPHTYIIPHIAKKVNVSTLISPKFRKILTQIEKLML